ncbi:MAG: GAF domain-containing protein [Gammaproteobacteria bacterium]|nr:GAF domain-containing protein [Gammaproteobacteria bacterium]
MSRTLENSQHNEELESKPDAETGLCSRLRTRFGHLMCNRLFISLLIIILFFFLVTITSLIQVLNNPETLSLIHLGLSTSGLLWTFYLFRRASRNLVHPLNDLREWTHRMSQGDLTARVPCPEQGQLRQLFKEINILSDTFSEISRNMEEKVQDQTRYIAKKNVTLQILYDVASGVNTTQDIQDLLGRSLNAVKGIFDARAANIRLLDDDNNFRLLTTSGFRDQDNDYELLKTAELELCEMAFESREIHFLNNLIDVRHLHGPTFTGIKNLGLISIPLTYHDKVLGIFNLFTESNTNQIEHDLSELLMNVGQHIGMAIQKTRLDEESRRVGIIDERNRLAHELHDSLAQSLASLRFQVRVLDDTLQSGIDEKVWAEMERIENSLDEAYNELRDLIAHCRIRNDSQDLSQNIKTLVNRYRNDTEIHFLLQIEWGTLVLPTDTEMQVLRIIQESLRNIYKHSNANTVRVLLSKTDETDYQVLIEDDGIGFARQASNGTSGEHIGLKIMQERARRFGGKLDIESEVGEGTRVTLGFSFVEPKPSHPQYLKWNV